MTVWRRWPAAALEWRAPLRLPSVLCSIPGLLGTPARRLALPPGLAVVGVGGSTLGGSGRTPLAIGLARALAARGHRVVFVGHGHGGRSRVARIVSPTDRVEEVGDEALLAARAVAIPVVCGPRADALALAAAFGDVAVVDRLLQTVPVPLSFSLLAVDALHPWGSGRVFPFGDLVASPSRLVALADRRVAVGGEEAPAEVHLPSVVPPGRWGLVTSCARPDRVARSVSALGQVVFHVKRPDHLPWSRRESAELERLARRYALHAWLLDPKSAVLRGPDPAGLGAPCAVIEHHVTPADPLVDRIEFSIRATMRAR